MRTRCFVPWLLVGSFALGGLGIGSVLAQQDANWPPSDSCKPSNKDTQDAKTLFALGKSSFQTSNYADAIKYWKDAYRRDCTAPLILKFIGQAYEADTQYANAIEVFKLYRVRGKPTGDELDELDQKIANLEKKVPSSSTTETISTTLGTSTSPTSSSTTTATTTATASASTTSTVEPPTTGGSRPIWPLAVGIGGATVTVVGGALWFVGNHTFSKKADDFTALHCNTGPAASDVGNCNSIANDASSAKGLRTIGIITTGVGAAAGIVGFVLYFTSKPSEVKSGSVVVTPGPGFAGVGLSGAF